MIRFTNVSKKYNGSPVVDNLSFEIPEGEKFVLLGTSGCGKTTTLKMINRLVDVSSGQIFVNGKDVLQQDPISLRRKMGYVIQEIGLFPHYSIEQNISVVPSLLGWEKDKVRNRVSRLLELLHLEDLDIKNQYPRHLSGGQRQRVGIARALASDPPIVLLDEPFGALDPITRSQIRKEFKVLEANLNKTMILVTHDVFEAIELSERICLLDQGHIQQIGTPREILFNPANNFVRNFFKANKLQLEMLVLKAADLRPSLPELENVPSETSVLDLIHLIESDDLNLDQNRLFESFNRVKSELRNI